MQFSQNNNKSSGIDSNIAEIYKSTFSHISQFLLKFFNPIFTSGDYPKSFGEGIIVPVFKGGDVEDSKNYRGITLINIISKIYLQILLNRLTKWSIDNETLIDNQFGFQKGKSTISCNYILHSVIARTLALKKKLYCCFIDYEKCFDKITRSHLFHKLITENVSSRFVRAIKSMYNAVKASVRYQSELSPFFTSNIGIKQGDPSSSLMFLYYVNDILSNIDINIDGICDINDAKLFYSFSLMMLLFLQKRHLLYNLC